MNRFIKVAGAIALGAFVAVAAAQGKSKNTPAPSRGEMLYGNHCTSCHDSIVHVREKRRAKSVGDVEYWVRRWSFDIGLGWKDEEVDAVTQHLVGRYYKFDRKK